MKKFFFLSLLSVSAFGVTLEKFQSLPEGGAYRQSFELGTSSVLIKGSNVFDPAVSDFRIGRLRLQKDEKIKTEKEKLNALAEKIRSVDTHLKKEEGTSFNELAGPYGHKVIYRVDGFMIAPESKYFAEVDQIFTTLQKQEWELEEGYELSQDLSKVMEYADGKIKKTEAFSKGTYCNRATLECTYYGGGKVRVKTDLL